MKHKSVIVLKRKKKYGTLMGPFFGIKDVKEAERIREDKERTANMTDRRMTVTLRPKSMGELAGWNLILSTYLEQGFAGGGDFQIRMDYKESDGLTMKLIKGKEKLRETHVKREPLDVAVRVMRNTSGFTLASGRRHESPGILLEQDTGASKDTIAVEEGLHGIHPEA
ncbi:hypothetical protein [Dialister hominis]|uniref:hypothetical protein n=1 Tax=Dialister hominis TaxID=2582419 RepID=UPI00205FB531|nr:MAG TPA: hypothetical protein [Caudoviricetes sp.]